MIYISAGEKSKKEEDQQKCDRRTEEKEGQQKHKRGTEESYGGKHVAGASLKRSHEDANLHKFG